MKYNTALLLIILFLMMGCSSNRKVDDGLGAALGWTTDEIAVKLAFGFVEAHGNLDWKLVKVDKTNDGWIIHFSSPEVPIVGGDIKDNGNSYLLSNRHWVFVQCDGWLVHGQIVG